MTDFYVRIHLCNHHGDQDLAHIKAHEAPSLLPLCTPPPGVSYSDARLVLSVAECRVSGITQYTRSLLCLTSLAHCSTREFLTLDSAGNREASSTSDGLFRVHPGAHLLPETWFPNSSAFLYQDVCSGIWVACGAWGMNDALTSSEAYKVIWLLECWTTMEGVSLPRGCHEAELLQEATPRCSVLSPSLSLPSPGIL